MPDPKCQIPDAGCATHRLFVFVFVFVFIDVIALSLAWTI
jgi:hypothetical protein